jgi:hypothetical protein
MLKEKQKFNEKLLTARRQEIRDEILSASQTGNVSRMIKQLHKLFLQDSKPSAELLRLIINECKSRSNIYHFPVQDENPQIAVLGATNLIATIPASDEMYAKLVTSIDSFNLLEIGIYGDESSVQGPPLSATSITLTNDDDSVSIYLYINPKEGFQNSIQCFGDHRIAFYLSPDTVVSSTSLVLDRYITIISPDDPIAATGKLEPGEYISKWSPRHSFPHKTGVVQKRSVDVDDDRVLHEELSDINEYFGLQTGSESTAGTLPAETSSHSMMIPVPKSTLILAINALAAELVFKPGYSTLYCDVSGVARRIADIIISMNTHFKIEGRVNTVTNRGRIIDIDSGNIAIFEEGCSVDEISFRRASKVGDLLVSCGVPRDLLTPVSMQSKIVKPTTLDRDNFQLNRKVYFHSDDE